MPTYLVESYLPHSEVGSAVAVLIAGRLSARHRWSVVLPKEDLCLHVLDGPSARVIREAVARAELRCQRISEVELITHERGFCGGRKEES
jgi:hypothetical protein